MALVAVNGQRFSFARKKSIDGPRHSQDQGPVTSQHLSVVSAAENLLISRCAPTPQSIPHCCNEASLQSRRRCHQTVASMELESVENVVVNILSRHDCCCLPVSDLFVLCSRVYAEHLLPQLGLSGQHLPSELHGLEGFVNFLRSWNSSNVALIGEGSSCMAQLCLPLSQEDGSESIAAACAATGQTALTGGFGRFETPHASENSGGSSTHPFYDPDASEPWAPGKPRAGPVQKPPRGTPDDRVTFIRQLLCRCVFEFVLKEANAQSYASAITLEDARQTCIQYLVRPRLLRPYSVSRALTPEALYATACKVFPDPCSSVEPQARRGAFTGRAVPMLCLPAPGPELCHRTRSTGTTRTEREVPVHIVHCSGVCSFVVPHFRDQNLSHSAPASASIKH